MRPRLVQLALVLEILDAIDRAFEFDNRYMFSKHITYIGSTMGTRSDFAKVMQLIFEGKFTPPIDQTFALRDARAAHERMEQGEFFGKIILAPPV